MVVIDEARLPTIERPDGVGEQEEVSKRVHAHTSACRASGDGSDVDKADQSANATVKTLSALTLSALSVEIECAALTERLMAALHLEQWRERARAALHQSPPLSRAPLFPAPSSASAMVSHMLDARPVGLLVGGAGTLLD